MSRVEDRLKELGLAMPPPPTPGGNYIPTVQTGNLLFTAGMVSGGATPYKGRVGTELTVEQGYEAAKQCVLNGIAAIKATVGDLDRIERVVKVLGFVNAGTDFAGFPQVMNGASDLLVAIFGEKGYHARSAIGVFVPNNFAVEVEMVMELKE